MAIERAAARAGISTALAGREDHADVARSAEAVLLCVPDAAISGAAQVTAEADPAPRFIGHVSGAGGLDELAAAERAGIGIFSLHPLQTIPDRESELAGAPCAIAARSDESLEFARALAGDLEMVPFELSEDARNAYHAAASIASNFLVTLEESAVELLTRAGIPNGRSLLTPLVLRTAENWATMGGEALTGPIARGDEGTVTRHLDALARLDPDMLEAYRAIARRTRVLATRPMQVSEAGAAG